MPSQTRDTDDETLDPSNDEERDQRFSQADDDMAGRSWHGMNSDTQAEVDLLEEDESDDEGDDVRAGRILRI